MIENNTIAQAVWIALGDQFRNNKESRAIYLSTEFNTFTQCELSISEYYLKIKSLDDIDQSVSSKTLVLTTLHGLNMKFLHMATLLSMQNSFPSFIKTRSHLLLEELKAV